MIHIKSSYFKILAGGTKRAVVDVIETGDKTALVSRVFVPSEFRGDGIGSGLLTEMLSDAHKEGFTLHIEPRPYGVWSRSGKKVERLKDFYKRFGFEVEEGNENSMIRTPKGTTL